MEEQNRALERYIVAINELINYLINSCRVKEFANDA